MSSALAIAGVTAVLRDLLNDGLINHNVAGVLGTSVTVSASPPDRVVTTGGAENSQLNLFMYAVEANPGWRNEGLPALDPSGRARVGNPPLALDLRYLLSAYSGADLHGEILLGYAALLLHDTPILSRAAINTALSPSPEIGDALPPALRALAECGLAEQLESIKITPEYLSSEEMSRVWSATMSSMRPSAAYRVSVLLMQSQATLRSALPVLSRGAVDPQSGRDRGVVVSPGLLPAIPTLSGVHSVDGQPTLRLGQTVQLSGHRLRGAAREVLLRNERFGVEQSLAAAPGEADDMVEFSVPPASAGEFPVGAYQVRLRVTPVGETEPRTTNSLTVQIGPDLTGLPVLVNRDGSGTASFNLTFTPALRPGQRAVLVLGEHEVHPDAFVPPVSSLAFEIADAPIGNHLARLRIDDVDSPIVDMSAAPPVFLDQRIDIQ